MNAISLWQPWASLVAFGEKKIETRSWSTLYRGALAIHATKGMPHEAWELCNQEPFKTTLLNHNAITVRGYAPNEMLDATELPLGAIVAVCYLTAVHRIPSATQHFARFDFPTQHPLASYPVVLPPLKWRQGFGGNHEFAFGDYTTGRFAWILTDVRALEKPIECKGAQRLWDVPKDVAQQVAAQL